MNENSLNNKLDRVDTAMMDIRDAMGLEQNEPIETIHELLKKDAVTTKDKLKKKLNQYIKEWKTWLDNSVNTYEIMFLEPVTLYSPVSTHKHYLIRRVDSSTYYVHWYQLSSAYMTHSLASFGFTSYAISSLSIKSSETVANTAISVTASTASSGTYYMSSAYSSFDDAVAAIQSPDTVYTKKSSSNSKLSISTESGYNFSATNIPALAFDESYAKAKRLSKNEIIEIIPTE